MGCDIHSVCEFQSYGMWFPAAIPTWQRDYIFFSMLAGVRAYNGRETIPPLAKGRGLPTNMCRESKEFLAVGDHGASWCSLEELENYDPTAALRLCAGDRQELDTWHKWIELGHFMARHHGVLPAAIRFVFNFDN